MIDTKMIAIAGAAGVGGGAPVTSSKTLGKDDFLKLLITQLRNQDPLNPLDQNQFLAQTAQFASLEQLQAINGEIEAIRGAVSSSSLMQAATLLGRTVRVSGSDMRFDGVRPVSLPFALDAPAASVTVEVLDIDGNPIRRLTPGAREVGTYAVDWDGRDGGGRAMAAGTYFYRVAATGTDGAPVIATAASGTLTGLQNYRTHVLYRMGDRLVWPGDVVEIH